MPHAAAPLSSAAPPARAAFGPHAARLTAALIMAAAAATALAIGGHPQAATDASLVRLLRAMAAIKILFAACAAAALYWRLALPVSIPRFTAYAAAAAALAAGPCLIWNMTHIAAGALLLHGGLLAMIVLLWRDPLLARLLEQEITRRRANLRLR